MLGVQFISHVARSKKQGFTPLTVAQFTELVGRIHATARNKV